MTSGQFHSVPIDSIIINREGRVRRELEGIPELADSIRRLGLIHIPVVTRDLVLVSGEGRLTACKSLGWTAISVQYVDEVPEHILRSIELEENIKRKNLSWPDESRAVIEYFELRKSEDPDFTQADLGASIGVSQQYMSKVLTVAEGARGPNKGRILAADSMAAAYSIAVRANDRRQAEITEQLHRGVNPKAEVESGPILNLDFNEWAKTYAGPRFNFVHCDFPYGIGADEFNQGGAKTHGGYKDTPETYWKLCESLCDNLDRLCADQCHFMFWFSIRHYAETLAFFAEHGIKLDPFPLMWMKSDNAGIIPDALRGPRRIYETAFFGSRGDRLIVRPVNNAFHAPTDQTFHMSIKPEPVLQHFFQMFVDEHTRMLDPTAGSGTSLRAAKNLNARYVLGLEVDSDFCEQANRALRAA